MDLPKYICILSTLIFQQINLGHCCPSPYLSFLEKQAYCRSCVHDQIPTAESWKDAIASAHQSLQTSSSTSFVKSSSSDHQDSSGETGQQQQQPQQRKLVPIFVVGMPRSGSTLLEHMLAQVRWDEGSKRTVRSNACSPKNGFTNTVHWEQKVFLIYRMFTTFLLFSAISAFRHSCSRGGPFARRAVTPHFPQPQQETRISRQCQWRCF